MAELRVLVGAVTAAALLAAGPPAGAETRTIAIDGMKFIPESFTVKRGDTVVWENHDLVAHTVTARAAFDSGPIGSGKAWRFVARTPGRFEYVCTLHPTMKAMLLVE